MDNKKYVTDWYDEADNINSLIDTINAADDADAVNESEFGKKFAKGVGAAVLAGTVAANSPIQAKSEKNAWHRCDQGSVRKAGT